MSAMRPRSSATTSLIVVAVFWTIFVWAWQPSILTLTLDDTYYYIKTAINAANGLGFTFDGINPTNGFHPLWMLVLLPLVAPEIDIDFLTRVVLTFQILLVVAGIVLVERIRTRKDGVSFTGMTALLLTNFYFTKVLVNGQESALQWFMLCACLACWWAIENRAGVPSAGWLLLGILGGLTILSRLDSGFFVLGLAAMPIVWPLDPTVRGSERWWRAFSVAAGSAALLLPYLAINLRTTGHLLPVSGAIKASGIGMTHPLVSIAIMTGALAVAGLFVTVASKEGRPRELRYLAPVVFYVCALAAYSKVARGAFLPEIWYLVPHMLLAAWALALVASRRVVTGWLVAGLVLFSLAVWAVRLQADSYSNYAVARRMGEWIERNTSEHEIVAGWDCGISAAFSKRRFVNLDGLINSWDFKERYMDTNRVQEYIAEHEIETIVQFFRQWEFNRPWLSSYDGVDLTPWSVAHAECFSFRSIVNPFRVEQRIYLILIRERKGTTLGELLEGSLDEACSSSARMAEAHTSERIGARGSVSVDTSAPPI